jgi:sec-independent protein translocase protein TatA
MLGNFGMTEILMLLVICLVLFGAKRIPEIGSSIGKGIREFKRGVSHLDDDAAESEACRGSQLRLARPYGDSSASAFMRAYFDDSSSLADSRAGTLGAADVISSRGYSTRPRPTETSGFLASASKSSVAMSEDPISSGPEFVPFDGQPTDLRGGPVRARFVRALNAPYPHSPQAADDVHDAARALVEELRSLGLPPERVLVTVKGIIKASVKRNDPVAEREELQRVIAWCIDAYYRTR